MEFGGQIAGLRQLMETDMDAAGGGADKASIEYVKVFYSGMFQAIEDGRAFLAAVDFRPEGMNLHLQFQVGADTKSNNVLREQKPATLEAIGTLPDGLMNYTAT